MFQEDSRPALRKQYIRAREALSPEEREAYSRRAAERIAAKRTPPLPLIFEERDVTEPESLEELAKTAEHIVILSDHDKDEDTADMDTIFLLLNLRDIRIRLDLSYNITAEMRREYNQKLVRDDDNTDFVVASNMSSLFLAQLSESPELIGAFRELLSNEGDEVYLKEAGRLRCAGSRTVAEIRNICFSRGYMVIGYRRAGENGSVFNPPLGETLELGEEDQLIVIGKG